MVIGYFRLELLLRLAKRPLSIFFILAGKLSFMREKVVSRGKEKVVSRGSFRYFDKTEFHSKRTKISLIRDRTEWIRVSVMILILPVHHFVSLLCSQTTEGVDGPVGGRKV